MNQVETALLAALDDERTDLYALVQRMVDAAPEPEPVDLDSEAVRQFLHAFDALLREGLTGEREQRDLVMETAVPALVASGQSALDLVGSHAALFTALSPRLLEGVPPELRGDASVWLAQYAADYTRQVAEVALAAERGSHTAG